MIKKTAKTFERLEIAGDSIMLGTWSNMSRHAAAAAVLQELDELAERSARIWSITASGAIKPGMKE